MPDEDTADERPDGGMEGSVNWEDDGTVLPLTLKQPNSGFGVARVLVAEMKRISRGANVLGALSWERRLEPGNPFHGNMVYRKGLPRLQQKMIATALTIDCTFLPPPSHRGTATTAGSPLAPPSTSGEGTG